jgi:hypothetical protein
VAELPDGAERRREREALGGREAFAPEVSDAGRREYLEPAQLRKLLVELSAVSVGMALALTLAVDFLLAGGLSWSRFTSLALVFAWLSAAMPLVLWKRPWLVFSVLGPSALVAVFLWFLFLGRLDLFLSLALPIAILLEAVVVATGVLVSIQRHKGLNSAGTVLAAVAILCLGIELCLSRFGSGHLACSWSAVVAISALPVAGLFFYLHYRVFHHASLRKIFRL